MPRTASRATPGTTPRTARAFPGLRLLVGALAFVLVASLAPRATAQDAGSVELKRETMIRLQRPVTLDVDGSPLREVIEFIETVTETDLDPLWADDRNPVGLDPDLPVSVKSTNSTALAVLERLLDEVDTAQGGITESTWQFTEYGGFEFGPKERLSRRRRVVVYDLTDLIFELPDFQDAPDFDLDTVFQAGGQSGGGGGGGQSPFDTQNDDDREPEPVEDRMEGVLDVLRIFVDPEGWQANGGTAARAQIWNSQLIVNAPDYFHRAIEGYSWWPSNLQRFASSGDEAGSRRWVTKSIEPESGRLRESRPSDVVVTVEPGQ